MDRSRTYVARTYSNLVFVESVRQALQLWLRRCWYEKGIVHVRMCDPRRQRSLAELFANLDQTNRSEAGSYAPDSRWVSEHLDFHRCQIG
jgi:hypothetical protein